jgi:hypothetical protein
MALAQPDENSDDLEPKLAVRRHTDRCFHRVEEIVRGKHAGYIVQGVLIPLEEVAETVTLNDQGQPMPTCRNTTRTQADTPGNMPRTKPEA